MLHCLHNSSLSAVICFHFYCCVLKSLTLDPCYSFFLFTWWNLHHLLHCPRNSSLSNPLCLCFLCPYALNSFTLDPYVIPPFLLPAAGFITCCTASITLFLLLFCSSSIFFVSVKTLHFGPSLPCHSSPTCYLQLISVSVASL